MREFDLVVIGAGSGLDVAAAAANRGQDVAVVDDEIELSHGSRVDSAAQGISLD